MHDPFLNAATRTIRIERILLRPGLAVREGAPINFRYDLSQVFKVSWQAGEKGEE